MSEHIQSETKQEYSFGSKLGQQQAEVCVPAQKRRYSQIDCRLRKELLQAIDTGRLSIKDAAEKLGINYSTAKNIVRIFRRESRMHKLPKRVSKALESVVGTWKKPGKKLQRFVAKKCVLFTKERLEDINRMPAVSDQKVVMPVPLKTFHQEKMLWGISESCPRFDFAAYTPLILGSICLHNGLPWPEQTAKVCLPTPFGSSNPTRAT